MRRKNKVKIHKKTADKLIEGFLRRVEQANNSNEFIIRITKVYLFGSYVKGHDKVSDIDLALVWERKADTMEEWDVMFKRNTDESYMRGASYFQACCSYVTNMMKFLRNRKKSISLHDFDHDKDIVLKDEYKVIYETAPKYKLDIITNTQKGKV